MMDENELKEIIYEINPFDEFNEDTDLLGEGILDSFSLIAAIENIEEKMDVNILENDVNTENFRSIKTISTLIDKLK